MYKGESYDVIVIGVGHAGCEAALASARMGCKTLMITLNLDSIAMMPCNPSIGGTAKGHLVKEIDALGGQMGVTIDHTYIQIKLLNTAKGPAVHSSRAQADKQKYQQYMKHVLEKQVGLTIKQDEVVAIDVKDGEVRGVITRNGAYFQCKTAVLTTGTYLRSKVIIGEVIYNSGPNGLAAANELSNNLRELGIELQRFKTGTPCRINSRSVDYSKMVIQPGDDKVIPFSFMSNVEDIEREQVPCYLTYTSRETHEIIRKNLYRAPLFSGTIEGVGPRYCPSIEDKVTRFADKERHQLFIEPEGEATEELYVQGMSSSLPEEVQIEMLRAIPGLENCVVMRTGYAIEYDCINPMQLKLSLELKKIEGLFFGGQINGTSGYEEAAAQGLIAGMNAALKVKNEEPIILDRSEAYIGVLIDDLVTKGTSEPYRIMTSRAEYRLILRQDNADLRLTEKGYKAGLGTQERYDKYIKRKELIEEEFRRMKKVHFPPSEEVNAFLSKYGSSEVKSGVSLFELIKRTEINYIITGEIDKERPNLPDDVCQEVETETKYEGYIEKQLQQIEQFKKLEKRKIPEGLDYLSINGLRIEAQQKLAKIKPENIGQASRISGVSPADISVLLVYLEQLRRKKRRSMMDIRETLKNGAENYGISLSEVQVEQFITYMNLLKEWNEKINLTTITEDMDIIKKHFIDSISIVKSGVLKGGMTLIDVGTGAGFPGIPVKIIMPDIKVILLDSLNKRINYLNEVIKELGLKDIETIHGRAEELSRDLKHREKYDIATARAVANLSVLSEYCIPYVKVGGYFIAMKGPSIDEEIQAGKNAIGTLGGKFVEIVKTEILGEEYNHNIVIVEKTINTNEKFPRKFAQIDKKPLK